MRVVASTWDTPEVRGTPSGASRQGGSAGDGSAALEFLSDCRCTARRRVCAFESEHDPVLVVHAHGVETSKVAAERSPILKGAASKPSCRVADLILIERSSSARYLR